MKKTLITLFSLGGLLISNGISLANANDQIRIAGSSTVYPFTIAVVEKFRKKVSGKTPIVESTGTGGGFKIFCSSNGPKSHDFVNASRAIKEKELKKCKDNGVTVTEINVGIDGIVLANNKKGPLMEITVPQLYQALAKQVKINNEIVTNPYKKWSDIDKSLPSIKIEVLGPPPSSGTRDALISLVMKKGAKSFGIKDKKIAQVIREDGHFIEAGENDNLIIRKLSSNKNQFGLFGYSFLEENQDVIRGAKVNGVLPTYDSIADFSYPIARNLYVYAKREKLGVTKNMQEFVEEYTSLKSMGEDGYLSEKGLIALPTMVYEKVRKDAVSFAKNK